MRIDMFRFFKRSVLSLGLIITTFLANSSVVMTNNRVIFHAENKDKTLQFNNKGSTAYLVQVWVDQGNDKSTPDIADAPFIVTPQIFRINPNVGQTARLLYTGDNQQPRDRESIFYLNFHQIPALNQSTADQNKLVMTLHSRLKVFYRPKTILGNVEEMPKKWTFVLQNNAKDSTITVNNPTGYYANLTTATLRTKQKSYHIAPNSVDMIAPYSSASWPIAEKVKLDQNSILNVTYVNDYGAIAKQDIPVQQP
jgi:fimbrial chaperone protein